MFQLIVAVVAISLVVILAVAMIWFGGSAFSSSSDRALYARLLNEGSQIEGALQLYQTTFGYPAAGTSSEVFTALVSNNFLASVPPGAWFVQGEAIYREISDLDQCRRMNQVAGLDVSPSGPASAFDGCPPCNDTGFVRWPGCRMLSTP